MSEIVSSIIGFVLGVLASYLDDRYGSFFHKSSKNSIAESIAPQIFSGKLLELRTDSSYQSEKDNRNSPIFTLTVISDLKIDGDREVEILTGNLEPVKSFSNVDDSFSLGLRLLNNTNRGISISSFCMNSGQHINLSNWSSRHVNPGESITVLYNLRDRPQKVTAIFDRFLLEYLLEINSAFVTPTAFLTKRKIVIKKIIKDARS